jgi:hypothetical protein
MREEFLMYWIDPNFDKIIPQVMHKISLNDGISPK